MFEHSTLWAMHRGLPVESGWQLHCVRPTDLSEWFCNSEKWSSGYKENWGSLPLQWLQWHFVMRYKPDPRYFMTAAAQANHKPTGFVSKLNAVWECWGEARSPRRWSECDFMALCPGVKIREDTEVMWSVEFGCHRAHRKVERPYHCEVETECLAHRENQVGLHQSLPLFHGGKPVQLTCPLQPCLVFHFVPRFHQPFSKAPCLPSLLHARIKSKADSSKCVWRPG